MNNKKTTFQNWVDSKYPFGKRKELAEKAGVREDVLSRDYRRSNGLEMIAKYARLTNVESVDFHGNDYGCEITGTLKINNYETI